MAVPPMSNTAREPARARSPLARHSETLIVTLLPAASAARLALALPCGVRLHRLARPTQLRSADRLLPEAVVIDPMVCDEPAEVNDALRAIATRTALIAYTAVSPRAMRRLVDMPALGGVRLVLFGVDDGPAALRALIADVRAHVSHHRVMDTLRHCAGSVPPEVDAAMREVLAHAGASPPTVAALARAAHLSVRTLQRRLREDGGPSPHWLIHAARALLARELLRASPLTVREIAHKVGYAKLHSFRALIRWSFGASPSDVRHGRSAATGPRWRTTAVANAVAKGSPTVAELA